jgi:hypothetical protein
MNSGRTPNDSEYSMTPVTPARQSITSHKSIVLPPNNNPSSQSLSQNYSTRSTSKIINCDLQSNINKVSSSLMEHASESPSDTKPHVSINSNAMIGHQCPSVPLKHRRYKITVIHSDELLDIPSNKCKTTMEVICSISFVRDFIRCI